MLLLATLTSNKVAMVQASKTPVANAMLQPRQLHSRRARSIRTRQAICLLWEHLILTLAHCTLARLTLLALVVVSRSGKLRNE